MSDKRYDADYRRLLSTERARRTTVPNRSVEEEYASDRSRVVFCAAFRRLQQKAQVFPLEENASVRTRLTHSLEVADLGRTMARKVSLALSLDSNLRPAFIDAIETGCLLHDIGNPPFGHFGEEAIQDWAKTSLRELAVVECRPSGLKYLLDFEHFNGNAQGFRVATRLQSEFDTFGLNLTFGQLGAIVKYPFCQSEIAPEASGRSKLPFEKFGIFYSDKPQWNRVTEAMQHPPHKRHPLVYIVEAADDVAYGLSDIEDAIEKGILSVAMLFNTLKDVQAQLCAKMDLTPTEGAFVKFRVALAREMLNLAGTHYITKHESMLQGTAAGIVDDCPELCATRDALRTVASRLVYQNDAAELPELGGFHVVRGLLTHLEPLLKMDSKDFGCLIDSKSNMRKKLPLQGRLFGRIPNKYVQVYKAMAKEEPETEWWARVHLIVDFVAGLTDSLALKLYQVLSGIRVQ